jgi:hypothetical protein
MRRMPIRVSWACFDHRARYRDLAEPLGEILGVQL